jgi:hypothetical protein
MKFLIQILELGIGVALISIFNIFINFRKKLKSLVIFALMGLPKSHYNLKKKKGEKIMLRK